MENKQYKIEVRRIAELLARVAEPQFFKIWDEKMFPDMFYNDWADRRFKAILNQEPQARAMLAEMYKAYQYGHVDGMLHEGTGNKYCHEEAIKRGLTQPIEKCKECGKKFGDKCERYIGSNCTFQD